MDNKFGFNFDNSYLKLSDVFYKKSNFNEFENPKLILFNEDLAKDLKLNINELKEQGAYILSANKKIDDGAYISMAYAGHQFGNFTMLGDGRATLIGEHIVNNEKYDIQLKGSGKTDFSRNGDGKAVLGPMIREYIISEAMHYLGISTTRSLAVVDTGEYVIRNGYEKGAILTRVAKSHIRFGTFEYAKRFCNEEELKELADYTINRHYPHLKNEEDKYLKFFTEVLNIQAELIAKWQGVGFIHGVMNTDNMSIVGETIDYGPCAFMNIYKVDTVFSSIDMQGRYSYRNQPIICKWNLYRLAEALIPLIDKDLEKAIEKLEIELKNFNNIFNKKYIEIMGQKLGIF
ncbi:MAG: YdiU family protein, partial [Eubacteriales bacterium]|nr:YdiU family protein [Eubacteriales bacterium]